MSIENIKNTMAIKEQNFYKAFDNENLNEVIFNNLEAVNALPSVKAMFGAVSMSLLTTFISVSLLGPGTLSGIITLISCSAFCFLASRMSISKNISEIKKNILADPFEKILFFKNNLYPLFLQEEIDEDMHDCLKLNLSLDEYKAFRVKSNQNIKYSDIYDFIHNINDINLKLEYAESEKYSVDYENIKKDINLTK